MTSKKQTSWPVPLKDRDTGLGLAVREYACSSEGASDEPAAYERVLGRLAERPRRLPLLAAGFGMGAAAAVLMMLLILHRGTTPGARQEVAQAPTAPTPPSPRSLPAPPQVPAPAASGIVVRLAAQPTVLPTGKVALADEASVVLSADALASGQTQAGRTEIALEKGSIELHVLPRIPGRDFVVSAGDYQFVVVGTAFTVSQSQTRLQLVVSEGKVAVRRGAERLTVVGAGGQWSVPLGPGTPVPHQPVRASVKHPSAVALREPPRPTPSAPASAPSPAAESTATTIPIDPPQLGPAPPTAEPVTQPAVARRDCGTLAGQTPQEALSCYQRQAAQGGLAGEAAQYEVARLWRDVFHDPVRALAAFRDQRARFPRGVLATEADLSMIELLPRLDRHTEALAESARFLKENPAGERRGEIHLLRGNIYREVLHDLDHAEREYARGAECRGRVGDDSRFLRAVCLEALGRVSEARTAYQDYLSQPKASHAQEAKERLGRLVP